MALVALPSTVARPTDVGLVARRLASCFVEARPIVQIVYLARFAVGYEMTSLIRPVIPTERFFLAAVSLELAIAAIYLFDGVMDVAEDRINGSTRPIASGRLPQSFAATVAGVLAAGSLLTAWWLGGPYPAMAAAILLLGYSYGGRPLRLKRRSTTAGGSVLVAGVIAFAWGAAAHGGLRVTAPLAVVAAALSLWMGLVGALCKDFADSVGDARTGRRTSVVVRGRAATGRLVQVNAVVIAVGFVVASVGYAPDLIAPALVTQLGTMGICHVISAMDGFANHNLLRLPYAIFMWTQLSTLAIALLTHTIAW